MSAHQPFTISGVRVFDGGDVIAATHLRVVDGRVDAAGDAAIARPGDALVPGNDGTLLPGLIDAHVHLLPGCTQLAALFGVTTVIDQFSKPEVISPELAAVAASEQGAGPVRAGLRTSGIGATAPGGHPTLAYAPIPYVTGPADAEPFAEARLAEGATHLKVIHDDGSGAMLDIPSLDPATIEALVGAAHRRGLPVVAHVSTAAGAVTVARCGVDVLAHVPFDRMSDREIGEVARTGVAVITTLSVIDGFPGPDGVMPLLAEPALAARLTPRWRKVLTAQSRRWMPPHPPDGAAARYNAVALLESGVRLLAGTDTPNPGLVFGASLHRELRHLARAGLRPAEALAAATSVPAEVFGLADRGRLLPGRRADLVLVDGDPTTDLAATGSLRQVWVAGRSADPGAYAGSAVEREGVAWLRDSNERIMEAIRRTWPDVPAPEEVRRDDGEVLGRLVPTAGGWQATTVFGAPLGEVTDRDGALETLHETGLACLAEPWWVQTMDDTRRREALLVEVRPHRVRLRWTDPLLDQPPSGRWYDLTDIDLSQHRPVTSSLLEEVGDGGDAGFDGGFRGVSEAEDEARGGRGRRAVHPGHAVEADAAPPGLPDQLVLVGACGQVENGMEARGEAGDAQRGGVGGEGGQQGLSAGGVLGAGPSQVPVVAARLDEREQRELVEGRAAAVGDALAARQRAEQPFGGDHPAEAQRGRE